MSSTRKKIEKLTVWPDAFDAFAQKLNEVIDAYNREIPIEGAGMKITDTDNGRRFEISSLTASGVCNEDGTITITISAPQSS